MSLEALKNYTFTAKYARHIKDKKRRETYKESVDRVRAMMHKKYEDKSQEVHDLIDEAYDYMAKKRILGSQRALQFGGDPVFKHNARMYNCTVSFVDRLRFFQECMYMLLCGCGVGFSVQKHHIDKLPNLVSLKENQVKYTIPDTIEGWSDAIGILISSYFEHDGEFTEYKYKDVKFDFSKIRPKGSRISGGGKAPGPEPLKKALKNIKGILDNAILRMDRRIKPIEAYDIVMHASDAVISGGVRRSATICLFSPDDEEMATAKTGNWFTENPQRGRSNNSALLLRDSTTKEQFSNLMKNVKEFGEPGFVWADSADFLPNPCVTIDTKVLTTKGWETIGSLIGTPEFKIYQDSRVFGSIDENGKESWSVDMSIANESVVNKASNARKTGINREIYEMELECGRTVKATDNHHFATSDGMVELKDLSIEDKILIPLPPVYDTDMGTDEFNLGYLVGLVFGDGCFTEKNSVRVEIWGDDSKLRYIEEVCSNLISDLDDSKKTHGRIAPIFNSNSGEIYGNKVKYTLESSLLGLSFIKNGVPLSKDNVGFIHGKSKDFKAGFVSGLFYADGHSEYNENNKTLSIRITSVKKNVLQDIQLVLQELGIFSRINLARKAGITSLPNSNREYQDYDTVDCYRLIIGGIYNCHNAIRVLFLEDRHIERIMKVFENRKSSKTNIFTSRVKSIRYVGNEDVYCLTENNRRTMIVNGMTSRRCVEIGMYPVDIETGQSGWQGCNLSTINCAKINSKEDFLEAARMASIVGTLQAGFTIFPYLGKTSERIFIRESLLGVSGTGWLEKPEICLDPEIQREAATAVVEANRVVSDLIGIPQAARTTCVKPEGSASCVLGTSSGIHPHHAKRYIRRVQANKMENIYQYFKSINPRACEESVWSANGTDDVISFCVEVPDGSKTRNQISAIELLKVVKSTQENWVMAGKVESLCTKSWLNHNVSNTINVKPDEWDSVEDFIYDNRKFFCGISLLPITGDKDYPQAPFTTIYTPNEMVSHYGDGVMFVSGLIETALNLWEDNLWAACDSLLGVGTAPKGKSKIEWKDRCEKFAEKYFDSNVKKLTYCMKDIYNYKLWTELKREYKDVDYTKVEEGEDDTELEQVLACSGGACELI